MKRLPALEIVLLTLLAVLRFGEALTTRQEQTANLPVPSVHLHAAGLQSSAVLHAPPWPTPVQAGPLMVLVRLRSPAHPEASVAVPQTKPSG